MQINNKKLAKIVIVAGGTGGHINAALAIGNMAQVNNIEVCYFSGTRYLDYQLFNNTNVTHLDVLGLRYSNPLKVLKSVILNLIGFFKLIFIIKKINPDALVGTGGYVCGVVLLAGRLVTDKVYILEQNSFLGLTNRLLANIAKRIFINFKKTQLIAPKVMSKVTHVGNPVKAMSIENAAKITSLNMNILIFGGSLGAKQVNQFVDKLLKQIPEHWGKVKIIHQVGKNGGFSVSLPDGLEYQQFEYLDSMGGYYQWADIIIARAGASSLSELELVKRPVYLIPFQAATDNHQELNATIFKEEATFPVDIYSANKTLEENVNCFIEFITKHQTYNKPSKFESSMSAELIVKTIMRDL